MVNSEFHILVTATANARKIIVMKHVFGYAKESKELIEYKAAIRAGKADYK